MKKLLLVLALVICSCSTDDATQNNDRNCYPIIGRGFDNRGDFIIIKYNETTNKRYSVNNYLDYLNQTQICEPINLQEQTL